MNKKIIILVFMALCGINISHAQKSKDSRNVLDYLKLINEDREYFHTSFLKDKSIKIEIKDTKNGYLKLTGDFEGWFEVALFRKKDRSPVLLVGENTCGPACGTDLYAYHFYEGDFIMENGEYLPDLTEKEIFAKFRRNRNDPKAEIVSYLYELPRKGRTIRVKEDVSGDVIYELKWLNDKFYVDRKVLDYYYLFPENELDAENARNAEILTNDLKNGYLKLKVPGSTIEVALFRKTDGTAILLYAENYCGRPRCVTAEITAKEYVDSEWRDITEEILPDEMALEKKIHKKSAYAAKYGYQYKIPRVGTTVKIVEGEDGKTIYNLFWKNDKFVVR